MMKATRTFNNGLYQENLYRAYYNTPAEKHVVSESLEQEAMPVLVHRLAAQLGYTESEAEVEKEFLCEMKWIICSQAYNHPAELDELPPT